MPDDFTAAKEHLSATLLAECLNRRVLPMFRRPRSLRDGRGWRNVHAVGIGRKITGGVAGDQLAVRVYVRRKFAKRSIPASHRIPSHIDGMPTDVIAAAPAKFACALPRQSEQRPVVAGISASHRAVSFGTIACFCRSTLQEDGTDDVFVLSCNHVFGLLDSAALDDPLFQPGHRENGAPANQPPFAKFKRSVALQFEDNVVDAAIGRLEPQLQANFRDEIFAIGPISGSAVASEQLRVLKHGRTTGLSEGTITDASFDHILKHPRNGAPIKFVNQLRIEPVAANTPFAEEGDSGSLVVRASDHAAVGLLFAKDSDNSGTYAVANRFEFVREQLHIDLLGQSTS